MGQLGSDQFVSTPDTSLEQNNSFLMVLIGVVILLVIGMGYYYVSKTNILSSPNKKIAKVGEEVLYQKDLDYAIQYSDPERQKLGKDVFLQKLVYDSILLQAASKEKAIDLDQTIYNSINKDNYKRSGLLLEARQKLEEKSKAIEGGVISIWFLNSTNGRYGNFGAEEGKKIAFNKITGIRDRVKNGELTIIQAGEIVKNDSSLENLDQDYKAHAFSDFSLVKDDQLLIDSQQFNDEIQKLKQGEVTNMYLMKDKDANGNPVEAYYMFGQITKRNDNTISNFNKWLQEQKKYYAITYY